MSLVVGEEFEGECKETCWNEILEKTKKFSKNVSYPSEWALKSFVSQSFRSNFFCTPSYSQTPQYRDTNGISDT